MPKLSTTRFGYSFTHLHTVIVLQQVLRFTKSFRGRSYSRCYSRYSVNHQYVTVHLAVDCRKSCRTCCDKSCSRKCSRYHSRYCSRCRCRSCGRCHIRSYCGMLLWYVTVVCYCGMLLRLCHWGLSFVLLSLHVLPWLSFCLTMWWVVAHARAGARVHDEPRHLHRVPHLHQQEGRTA